MKLPDTFQMRIEKLSDARTGREIWKAAGWDDAHCVAAYPYYQAFSGDERYLIFASDRGGMVGFYRLELSSGETRRITAYSAGQNFDSASYAWLHNVHPNGREVFFADDKVVWAVDIQSLERRVAVSRGQNRWRKIHGGPSISADGRRLVCGYQHENGRYGIAVAELSAVGREAVLQEVWRREDSDEPVEHITEPTGGGHVASFWRSPDLQNNPKESRENRAALWKVDTSGRAGPLLVMPPGFRATHMYWGPDGRLYFHKKSVPKWTPTWIASVNGDGEDFREDFGSDTRKLGHSAISNDLKWIVSDVQDPAGNELYLIDRATGKGEILCWPDSTVSANGQFSHVHPTFSPSGRYIAFTSDKLGKAAVYVVPLSTESSTAS